MSVAEPILILIIIKVLQKIGWKISITLSILIFIVGYTIRSYNYISNSNV